VVKNLSEGIETGNAVDNMVQNANEQEEQNQIALAEGRWGKILGKTFVEEEACIVLVENCWEHTHCVLYIHAQRHVWLHSLADSIEYDCVVTHSHGPPID
jgi:hypothetical protein